MGLDHHEFVSTQSGCQVGGAHLRLDSPGDLLEEEVADMMPQRIIDGFEAVEVQHVDRHQVLIPPGIGQRFLQPVIERSTIGQTGKHVMVCLVIGHLHRLLELCLRFLALGDVFKYHHSP